MCYASSLCRRLYHCIIIILPLSVLPLYPSHCYRLYILQSGFMIANYMMCVCCLVAVQNSGYCLFCVCARVPRHIVLPVLITVIDQSQS